MKIFRSCPSHPSTHTLPQDPVLCAIQRPKPTTAARMFQPWYIRLSNGINVEGHLFLSRLYTEVQSNIDVLEDRLLVFTILKQWNIPSWLRSYSVWSHDDAMVGQHQHPILRWHGAASEIRRKFWQKGIFGRMPVVRWATEKPDNASHSACHKKKHSCCTKIVIFI